MKDFLKVLIYFWPLILALGYLIFYIIVFVEYKDVPISDVPAWVYLVLYNNSRV